MHKKVKDADKLHLLKITDVSNLCHQKRIRCEKNSWVPHRGFNPLHELKASSSIQEALTKVRGKKLEERSIDLGRGCQCIDRLWVKLTAPPERNVCYIGGESGEGRGLLERQGRKLQQPAKWDRAGSRGAPGHYLPLSCTLLPSAPFGCEWWWCLSLFKDGISSAWHYLLWV